MPSEVKCAGLGFRSLFVAVLGFVSVLCKCRHMVGCSWMQNLDCVYVLLRGSQAAVGLASGQDFKV